MTRNPINASIVALLPHLPRGVVWRFSRRYIAGMSLQEAFDTVERLNREGALATLDVLGEDVRDAAQVDESVALYREALRGIAERGLRCNVSVKLSEMGLRFDVPRCRQVMEELAGLAAEHGNFVRIDMEDSSVTDLTLDVYRRLRRGHENVGTVLQARLRRTPADVEALLAEGIAHLRLCKGIYREPASIAHQRPGEISAAYREVLDRLLASTCEKVAIATHDPALVDHALRALKALQVDRERYEFQMLLGVARRLRRELIAAGHPLRVYVPFGEHWFAYSLRRLRENPAIAGHVARNLVVRD